jgi:hypothetical protein
VQKYNLAVKPKKVSNGYNGREFMRDYVENPQHPKIESTEEMLKAQNPGYSVQAGKEWEKLFDITRNYEESGKLSAGKVRIHKGGILHNWGHCILQDNKQMAYRLIALASIEDLLDYDTVDIGKNCPAFQKILNEHLIPLRGLQKIEQEVIKAIDNKKVPANPEAILQTLDIDSLRLLGEPIKVTINKKSEPVNAVEFNIVKWAIVTDKIRDLQADFEQFKIDFIDRESFKKFCDNLALNLKDLKEICITGYFSETIRAELENIAKNDYYHIRIISPDFTVGTPREKKNLEALRKLSKAGVEVKFNSRMHARLLVAHSSVYALLVLGSFDYNTECIGKERYDAGIKTTNPDLVKSAINFFEQVWIDSETQTMEQFLKDRKIST